VTEGMSFDRQDFMQRLEAEKAALQSGITINKEIVFEALAAASVTRVVVDFDGAGDEGQIEEIEAFAEDRVVDLPAVKVSVFRDNKTEEIPLEDGIEQIVYDALEASRPGWEINEGSYGSFGFDVATRTITLEFEARIITTDSSQEEF
jgi:hypothetical protein